ncbi:MAG: primosomal protein N' [candidate division WOR-3 bacterium]|nr:MAG: primosomal protein N' [candidate division WOR-3 bacterium]
MSGQVDGCPRFCDVIIPRTRLNELTYCFDPDKVGKLAPGDCVEVLLRGRPKKGVVLEVRDQSPVPQPLEVGRLVDPGMVGTQLLGLLRWVAGYYWSSMGEVLSLVMPRGICGYRPRKQPGAEALMPAMTAGPAGELGHAALPGFRVVCSARGQGREDLVAGFVHEARKRGPVLVLLPDAALADWLPQLSGVLGSDVIEYHAGMSVTERKRAWLKIRQGGHWVVVGTRSAVFAPVEGLAGVVVVDGHKRVFKEERHPRFHARDVAVARARMAESPVLLCDPTPSAETWFNLDTGMYRWLEQPAKPGRRSVSYVADMRRLGDELLSPRLVRELERAAGHVAVLYVNRRDLSRHVACSDCGTVLECANCGIPLVLTGGRLLRCGVCGETEPAPESCPECQGTDFKFRAPGVDMAAAEVERRFPGRNVVNVTKESVGVLPGEPGTVVVGTRALLSRPWPAATKVVAAVCFDYELILPDFRARERAFQVLFRLETLARRHGARMVVQTRRPDDPAVVSGLGLDTRGFMRQEMEARRELRFPPFRRLALLEFESRDPVKARNAAVKVARAVSRVQGADAVGPVELPGRHRGKVWRVLVRTGRRQRLDSVLQPGSLESRGVELRVDVDPLDVT